MHAEEGTIIQIVNSLMFEWENLDLNELKLIIKDLKEVNYV